MGSDWMSDVRVSGVRIGLAVMAGMMAGCGDGDQGQSGATARPAATIVIDGSSTVVRISEAARDAFQSVNPAVTVVVDEHGTGGGFSKYLENEVDIVDASRDAKPDEEKRAKEQGIEWTRFLVGYDGITVVVNVKNDFVKDLSVEQLKSLWAPGSKIRTWKDINPSWPDRPIVLYSPDNDSGTFDFFTEAIVGKMKSQRDDVQQNSSDNSLVQGVAGDVDGMGYFGYPYYSSNKDKLRAVAIRNGQDARPVLPGPETIQDKSYAPLSRPLYIFVKNSAARRPEMAQFVRHYLDNIDKFATEGGYDAPMVHDKAANQEALTKLLGGESRAPVSAKNSGPAH
jgi:phosphate transport system substrate-binding protein